MSNNIPLELILKLQDKLTPGVKKALNSVSGELRGVKRDFDNLSKSANLKTTGLDRMIKSMGMLRSATKGTFEYLNKMANTSAAMAAGGYVVNRALEKPMAYADRLAAVSNIAYSDRDVSGRIAGQMTLNQSIRRAQQSAGGRGNQDDLAIALSELVGSGAMGDGQQGVKNSMDLLPELNKAQIATGAEIKDLVGIVTAAKQTLKMTNKEIKMFLSNTIVAGNEGGFEIKDMARYLPEQMAKYAAFGARGLKGGQDLLGYNEVSRITAGTSEAAGINMINLLNKVNAKDTQNDFKKLGIDLTGSLVKASEKNIGVLDAFASIVDDVANKDPEYRKLKSRAEGQKGQALDQTLEAMLAILQQRGLGNVVQDSQAMSALLAVLQQKEKLEMIRGKIRDDDGKQVDKNLQVMNSTAFAAKDRVANAKDKAAYDMALAGDGPIKSLLNGAADLSEKFPNLSAAAYAASTALAALAASAGVGSILGGGKGVAGKALAAGKGGLARMGAGVLAGGSTLATTSALAAGAGAGAAAAGWGIGTLVNKVLEGTKINDSINRSIASLLATLGNREAKQAMQIYLSIDGKQVAATVEKHYGRFASRK